MFEIVPLFTFPILLIIALIGLNVFYNYRFTKNAVNQSLKSGNVVAFSGEADSGEAKTSPITGEDAIFYCYEVRSSQPRGGNTTIQQEEYCSDEFKVQKDGETVLIDTDSNFQNDLSSRSFSIRDTPLGGATDIEKFDYGEKVEDYINGRGDYIRYYSVAPSDEVTVIGELTLTDNGTYKMVETGESKPGILEKFDNDASERIVLYDGNPEEYISKNKKWVLISSVLFIVLSVITVYSLFTAI